MGAEGIVCHQPIGNLFRKGWIQAASGIDGGQFALFVRRVVVQFYAPGGQRSVFGIGLGLY